MGCYLAPDISQLHDPQGMKDAGKAAGILAEKISEGKKIRIIGDYDVDGVVATYIFMETLLECGADVDYRIPERVRDGYGLNLRLVEEAAADGVDTILTCDDTKMPGNRLKIRRLIFHHPFFFHQNPHFCNFTLCSISKYSFT